MTTRAAIYLRSSKDRSDVSIDVQRRELQQLATDRDYVIVEEFSDVVESGKDELRDGFQKMLTAVRRKSRGWETILILDTSRLARRRHISLVFEEVEAKKHGVRVVYKSLPDSDPITEMLLKSILQAMDEWHSLTSKQKGLAGMAENVRQGWRAGGRAPMGYALEHISTGAMREGMPVRKSKLITNDDAPKLKLYLTLRAQGMARPRAAETAGLESSSSTLVGVEWNALTYAGHTVWNVRFEQGQGGFTAGVKRRPRKDWQLQRDTHEALISDEDAETLLVKLESFDRGHHSHADYLLTGLLKAPDGTNWRGSDGGAGGYYRLGKGKRIKASTIEDAVIEQLKHEARSPVFIKSLVDASRKQFDDRKKDVALPGMKKELSEFDRKIERLTGMLADISDPQPLLRQIETYEAKRNDLCVQVIKREEEAQQVAKVKLLGVTQVEKILRLFMDEFESADRMRMRELLKVIIGQISMDETARSFQTTYRIATMTGLIMASPRGDDSMTGGFASDVQHLKRG